jgi:hypothetical protein
LPIHPNFLRYPNSFRPAFAKIPVEEAYPLLRGHALADTPNEVVFLKATVEKGRRKGVESTPPGDPCHLGEPQGVAVPAPLLFAESDLPEELLHGIGLIPDDRELFLSGIYCKCLKALSILLVRVNVGINISTGDLIPFLSQYPERVYGAGGATDMQQDCHGHITDLILDERVSKKPLVLFRITPSGRPPASVC